LTSWPTISFSRRTLLYGVSEGKRTLGIHRRKWEDNIRMNLREITWQVVNWIHLAHDGDQWRALPNTEMNLWVS